MITLLYCLSAFWLLIAFCGAVYTQAPKHVPNLSFLYYAISLIGHLFTLPLLITVLGVFATSLTVLPSSPWLTGMSAVSACLCGVILWQSYRGRQVLAGIIPEGPQPSKASFWTGALFPLMNGRKGVRRIKDVAYGDAGVKNTLDIYVPEILPETSCPVLIHIHGGAWVVGRKRQQAQPLMQHLVSRGWIAVDINYRLGPKHRMDVVVSDVLRAIGWVKTNIADYGGDPNFVATKGGSAGGHLTALTALMPNNNAFKAGFEDVDCSVDAAVPVYGVYDFLDRTGALAFGQPELEAFMTKNSMTGPLSTHRDFWDNVTPMGNIHKDAPPMFVLHGRHDALAAFKGAEIFVSALREVSKNDVLFAALPSGQHAYDCLGGPPTQAHIYAVERFLNKVRAEKSAS
ncbi:MAG: alpha/beta hydrolase fold domain-containing protein [Alphaproteobacteria bacterium]